MLDLFLQDVLDIHTKQLVLCDNYLNKVLGLSVLVYLVVHLSDLGLHPFYLFLDLSCNLCILKPLIVGLLSFVLSLSRIQFLLVNVLFKAMFVIQEHTFGLGKSLMLHDHILLQLLGLFLFSNDGLFSVEDLSCFCYELSW